MYLSRVYMRLTRVAPSTPSFEAHCRRGNANRPRCAPRSPGIPFCGIAEWKAPGNGDGLRKHIRLRLNGPAFDGTYCPLRRSANTRTWPAGVRARFPLPWKVGPPHDLTRDDSQLSVCLHTVEIAACLCFYSGESLRRE